MFQFLNPIWLFGAAALVIPVLVHLWNVRPGKVLKVGSISLIEAASRKSSRSFKLLDIPLFILRCLLLLLLALLLAAPIWQKKLHAAKTKGWLLIPKEHFKEAYERFKPVIDSLNKAGYAFHYFNDGFPQSNVQQVLLHPADSLRMATQTEETSYWNLVRQLDRRVSSDMPVYLFTPNQSRYFKGAKPQAALNLHWRTFIPADSTANWIEHSWFTTDNSIRVVHGKSGSQGTSYTFTNVSSGNPTNTPYTLAVDKGNATIALKDSKQSPILIDTATLRIAIYADNNMADAGYLKAALQAASQFTQRRTIIRQYIDQAAIPGGQDWIFWLSEKSAGQSVWQRSSKIFCYQKGKPVSTGSWINNGGTLATAWQQQSKINLYKSVPGGTKSDILWRDGFGRPVLDMQAQGQKQVFRFYSRFSPAWNDLVWSSNFPAWILNLIYPDDALNSKYDRRTLSHEQLMPKLVGDKHNTSVKITGITRLMPYFWLALVLIFMAERWLANRSPKTAMA